MPSYFGCKSVHHQDCAAHTIGCNKLPICDNARSGDHTCESANMFDTSQETFYSAYSNCFKRYLKKKRLLKAEIP